MLGGCGCFLSTEGWVVGLWSCSREAFKQADSVPGVAIEIGSAARGGEPLCLGSATAWFQGELAVQGNLICHFLSLGGQRRSDRGQGVISVGSLHGCSGQTPCVCCAVWVIRCPHLSCSFMFWKTYFICLAIAPSPLGAPER